MKRSRVENCIRGNLWKRKIDPNTLDYLCAGSMRTQILILLSHYSDCEIEEIVKEARFASYVARKVAIPNFEEFVTAIDRVIPISGLFDYWVMRKDGEFIEAFSLEREASDKVKSLGHDNYAWTYRPGWREDQEKVAS